MKRILLSFFLVGSFSSAMAQCTPDPLYADSLFGVWPDTTTNFVGGVVGEAYIQVLNLIVPQDGGDVDPAFEGQMLDSVAVNGVTGLPPGLTWACNSQTPASCSYLTGQLGCGIVEGVPTAAGTFPLTLNVTAYTTFLGFPVPVPYTFNGYRINVSEVTGITEGSLPALGSVRTVPNPFASRTMIEFQLSKASTVKVRVFNLLGEELWSQTLQGKAGTNKLPFEGGDLQDGVYLFKVESGKETFTGRMVLHR